ERGRSPPAARRSVEVVWSNPEPLHLLCCCGPGLRRAEVASATQAGRSAVRQWRFQDAPRLLRISWISSFFRHWLLVIGHSGFARLPFPSLLIPYGHEFR